MIYWTAIFGHRKCSGEVSDKTGVPEGLPEPPGEVLGLSGPEGRERAADQEVARPLPAIFGQGGKEGGGRGRK